MKELSIEQKAKRYNEVIEKLRDFYKDYDTVSHIIDVKEELANLIPELKENEDERIRKELIDFVKSRLVGFPQCEKFIAWLEKQGEQKHKDNYLLNWSKIDEKMLQSLECIVKDYWAKAEQEKNEIKIREASNVSYFLKTIQKSPLCWIKCSDGLPNRDGTYLVVTDGRHNNVYDIARYDSVEGWHKASEVIYWMPIPQLNSKSIIEQKPADKAEPKFHEGDCIVDDCGYVWKVKEIMNQFYLLKGVEEDESLPTVEFVDKTFHPWTIQDAKDGDMLAYDDGSLAIFHYRLSGLDAGLYMSHILLTNKIEIKQTCAVNNVHPATKEQRNALMKAMADAGYIFDFEKKELKKIEQQPAWSREDEQYLLVCKNALRKYQVTDKWDSNIISQWLDNKIKSLRPQKQWKQENTSDLTDFENTMMHIGNSFFGQYAGLDPNDTNAIKEQANLLLELVPSKEWSEDDENKLNRIYMLLTEAADEHAFSTTCRLIGDKECVELQDFLKSLKPQKQWRPSDEQMKALHDLNLTGNISYAGQGQTLIELYNDLKRLKQ